MTEEEDAEFQRFAELRLSSSGYYEISRARLIVTLLYSEFRLLQLESQIDLALNQIEKYRAMLPEEVLANQPIGLIDRAIFQAEVPGRLSQGLEALSQRIARDSHFSDGRQQGREKASRAAATRNARIEEAVAKLFDKNGEGWKLTPDQIAQKIQRDNVPKLSVTTVRKRIAPLILAARRRATTT